MAERLYRAQILLEPDQHERLARLARREGRSLSEVVRGMVQAELERREGAVAERRRYRLEQIEAIRQSREQMLARRGGAPLGLAVADLIRDLREERDEEIVARLLPPRP